MVWLFIVVNSIFAFFLGNICEFFRLNRLNNEILNDGVKVKCKVIDNKEILTSTSSFMYIPVVEIDGYKVVELKESVSTKYKRFEEGQLVNVYFLNDKYDIYLLDSPLDRNAPQVILLASFFPFIVSLVVLILLVKSFLN